MTNMCETDFSVHGNQRQAADVSWISIDRKAAKQRVNKLQQQIFQATRDKNFKVARRLKKLLFKLISARFLSVLSVTTNQGRYTPGVDGIILKTEEISKFYQLGKVQIPELKNINLHVMSDDFLVIAGPSGSGKTSL